MSGGDATLFNSTLGRQPGVMPTLVVVGEACFRSAVVPAWSPITSDLLSDVVPEAGYISARLNLAIGPWSSSAVLVVDDVNEPADEKSGTGREKIAGLSRVDTSPHTPPIDRPGHLVVKDQEVGKEPRRWPINCQMISREKMHLHKNFAARWLLHPSPTMIAPQAHKPARQAAQVTSRAPSPRTVSTELRIWKASSTSIFISFRCLVW